MEVKAIYRFARMSAFKLRDVTREIQGRPVAHALDIVAFSPPLIISESEIDEMMACFGKALHDTWSMVRDRNLV